MSRLADCVADDPAAATFRVHRRVFVDADVLEAERRCIFDRSWLYVGHESEIASPGQFVTRNVGGRPVILVRSGSGDVNVLLNSCTHRGNQVCRAPSGRARAFQCFYHSWTFDRDGLLIGVPGQDGYGPSFDRGDFTLRRPAHVDSYRGLVFCSFGDPGAGLADFLGPARPYLDDALDYSVDGLEVVPGVQQYVMHANWKLLVENSVDGYHALATHHRYFRQFLSDVGVLPPGAGIMKIAGAGRALGNGHALIEAPFQPPVLAAAGGAELAEHRARLVDRFGEERTRPIADYARNLFIFPNLLLISNWRAIRTWYPAAPGETEVEAWGLLPKGESAALRRARLDNYISFLGPGGFGTPDDNEALEGCQRGFATHRELPWSDVSRGMTRDEPEMNDEEQMRGFWRRWAEMIDGPVR